MNLTISLLQTALLWEDKAGNLASLEKKINELKGKTEVIVLPEMFSTGFTMDPEKLAEKMDGPTIEWMKKLSRENRTIITGSFISEDDGYYNRMIWMQPDGNFGQYDKRHLFAYSGEDEKYKPGNKRLITSVKGFKINLQVCYDLRFPVWARQQIKEDFTPEYDVLIYVANWPARRSHAWKSLLVARAIENQCYVIGVNRIGIDGNEIMYSGDSIAIDPLGETIGSCGNEENILTVTLSKENLDAVRNKFPFLKDSDDFILPS